jgi:hypothetical protein
VSYDINEAKKALVVSIEKSLLKVGKPVYDLVITALKKKYHCHLPDCFEHPEYLSEILSGIYGYANKIIIESINSELSFSDNNEIAKFLKVVCNPNPV